MNAICNALRETPACNHDDICTVVAGVAAWLKNADVLSAKCSAVLVDAVDEIFGQVEQDKIDQQKVAAWTGREIPGFGDLRGQLDALTVRGVAA